MKWTFRTKTGAIVLGVIIFVALKMMHAGEAVFSAITLAVLMFGVIQMGFLVNENDRLNAENAELRRRIADLHTFLADVGWSDEAWTEPAADEKGAK